MQWTNHWGGDVYGGKAFLDPPEEYGRVAWLAVPLLFDLVAAGMRHRVARDLALVLPALVIVPALLWLRVRETAAASTDVSAWGWGAVAVATMPGVIVLAMRGQR